jgi:hypothetical protein
MTACTCANTYQLQKLPIHVQTNITALIKNEQNFSVKIQTHTPAWQVFSPLSLTLSIFLAIFFSDLTSENP